MLDKIYAILAEIREVIAYKRNKEGMLQVESSIRKGSHANDFFALPSIDFSERATWYQNSTRVQNMAQPSPEDPCKFTIPEPRTIINPWHKKLSMPTGCLLGKDKKWHFKEEFDLYISIDGQSIAKEFYTLSEDMKTIIFKTKIFGTVGVSYCVVGETHASQFLLQPVQGMNWFLEHAEIQFSASITLTDTLVFQMWAGREDGNYTWDDPLERKTYLQYEMLYRNGQDYLNICNEGKGTVPAFGGPERGLVDKVILFPALYLGAISLGPSYDHTIIRVLLENDLPFQNCEIATSTFYTEFVKIDG